jgi:hypothetical protein
LKHPFPNFFIARFPQGVNPTGAINQGHIGQSISRCFFNSSGERKPSKEPN